MTKEELKEYLKRDDLVVENNTAKWDISHSGDINGLYTGTFVFKCFLTPSEKLAAGRQYRELLGTNPVVVSEHEDNLAFSISQLRYRVISAPPFWASSVGVNGVVGDLPDEKVLDVILQASLSAEFKYLALLQDKKEKALEKAKKVAESISENKESDEDAESKD